MCLQLPQRSAVEVRKVHPVDVAPEAVIYPDAVTCAVMSPANVTYKIIFYKSQMISFASQPDNAADYGTTFNQDPDHPDSTATFKWRLQLGKPGNITMFALPTGWATGNCPVGKSIEDLTAGKQVLRLFTTQ